MSRQRIAPALTAVGMLIMLSACAAGPNALAGGGQPAGFWLGLWHGFIIPISFIVSLFNSNVSIYEVHNNGNWYDFGFMVGISAVLSGGPGASGHRSRRRRRRADVGS